MRVLELGDNAAAGYCGRLFALWGADVIRVDLPSGGLDPATDYYLNSNKRRVGLDYTTAEGRDVLAQIADRCDVLVTDVPADRLAALDWQTLGGNARPIIRTSITPFGLSGPARDWEGAGPVLLAMGGYTWLMGDRGREPLSLPGHYVEYQSGQYAYIAASALMLQRLSAPADTNHTVEISMLETVLSLSQFTTVMWTCSRLIRERYGNAWANLHPIAMYPCKDGWFLVNVVPGFWPAFTKMLGREELLTDERFATNQARVANRDSLDAIITWCLSAYTMAELMELGQRKFRVPTGGAFTLEDVLNDEHLNARGYFQTLDAGSAGTLKIPGPAFRFVASGGNPPAAAGWQAPGELTVGSVLADA